MIQGMNMEFRQISWDRETEDDWKALLSLAIREDLGDLGDLTSLALVPPHAPGRAAVVARQRGVVAGLAAARMTLAAFAPGATWIADAADGQTVQLGQCLARIEGPAAAILAAERTLLNVLGRLSGIATLTHRYVEAIAGTHAAIYDTRKTTPGWRRLEKYAVRCGGGRNHRTGLFEAVLIKDNHLAFGAEKDRQAGYCPAEAVRRAQRFLASREEKAIIEVEAETLEQLDEVLPAGPDLVLLDNMPPDVMRQAVARRDAGFPGIELEASGGVNLQTVRAIAASGVDRISVGALTHSAAAMDVALDWASD
jgi:nicotinate-nucleotide pyrophosphorylase (carboxylating)